ncbi:MAG: poly-gamma-glutamate synthase PgsB, partial [Streptomyces sp.]|nr:poly-gamma-glutamate synthase PgsB [Streptomyces sp.]
QGDLLLEHLAALPADDSPDEPGAAAGEGAGPVVPEPAAAPIGATASAAPTTPTASALPALPGSSSAVPGSSSALPAPPEHVDTMQLYAPRIDPYQRYPEAYETRYGQRQPAAQDGRDRPRGYFEPRVPPQPLKADPPLMADPPPAADQPAAAAQPPAEDQQWHSSGEPR